MVANAERRLLRDITVSTLVASSKAAQLLLKDKHRGTKDAEQPPASAKPKSMHWSQGAVIWGLQIG